MPAIPQVCVDISLHYSVFYVLQANLTVCQSIVCVNGELLSGLKDFPRQSIDEHWYKQN